MRYSLPSSNLFSDRRKGFVKKMEPGSIAIFFSNDPMPRTADQFYSYRQDSALFSLSGLDQEGTIIVLFPSAKKKIYKEIAFISPNDPLNTIWNGKRLSLKEAAKISGIRTVLSSDQWDEIMPRLIKSANSIYTNSDNPDPLSTTHLNQNKKKITELSSLYPRQKFLQAQSILRKTMMIKHPEEIKMIEKAIEITGMAFDRVLREAKPGMMEYELEAEITYIFSRNGSRHAFEPIIASGKSANILHYVTNDKVIAPGSLILLDFGAEYANMNSDMTRTIPASGRFTKEQKNFYLAVLHVLHECTNMMRPGIKIADLNKEAGKLIESELIRLKILTRGDVRKQDVKRPLWKKYFMHGISHHLGYDVHDISDRDEPLAPGMVLTCEPGLYIPELKMGIRLENDILITKKDPRNLMASIPIDPGEIETIMQSKT